MSKWDAVIIMGLVVAIVLGAAGASWEAGRRYERQSHACPPFVFDASGPELEQCQGRLDETRRANRSCTDAVLEVARVSDGCRRFLEIGPGPKVVR
jgi:hypothetical protein